MHIVRDLNLEGSSPMKHRLRDRPLNWLDQANTWSTPFSCFFLLCLFVGGVAVSVGALIIVWHGLLYIIDLAAGVVFSSQLHGR